MSVCLCFAYFALCCFTVFCNFQFLSVFVCGFGCVGFFCSVHLLVSCWGLCIFIFVISVTQFPCCCFSVFFFEMPLGVCGCA